MKKIFLSLSAIALLAVGTVSCGGDDSSSPVIVDPVDDTTPDDTTPGETAGAFLYQGQTFELDNSFSLVGAEGQNVKIYDLEFSDGSTERATRWDLISFSGDDVDTSLNYHQFRFYIPVGDGDVVIEPNEMETFIPGGAVVYANNATTPVSLGTLSAYQFGVDTFVQGYDPDFGNVAYGVNFTGANSGVIQMAYTGLMDGAYLQADAPATTSNKQAPKGNKLNMGEISKLGTTDGGKVYIQAKPVMVK